MIYFRYIISFQRPISLTLSIFYIPWVFFQMEVFNVLLLDLQFAQYIKLLSQLNLVCVCSTKLVKHPFTSIAHFFPKMLFRPWEFPKYLPY